MNMNPFKNTIDNIFSMPESILNFAINQLASAGQVAGQGLNISSWLGPVGWLGQPWTKIVNSLLAGASIVLIIWVVKRLYMLYIQFKEGVQWW